jgi:hypothetical protein
MKKIVFVVCILLLSSGNCFLFAQNNNAIQSPQSSANKDIEISYGTFVKASPNEIVLSEYDAEQDANVNISYEFTTDTKLTNAVSVDKISPGADIEIFYAMVNGKKTAKNLIIELPEVISEKK